MATHEAIRAHTEWRKTLRIGDQWSFGDELGSFGMYVAPRSDRSTSPAQRQAQREDYCLRRLLAAWHYAGDLRRPVTVSAPLGGGPDFYLHWDDGSVLAIEVTQAGSNDYQQWLTRTERTPGLASDAVAYRSEGYAGAQLERIVVRDIETAIRGKLESKYPSPCHLLTYVNSENAFMADKTEVVDHLHADIRLTSDARAVFCQIHLIHGRVVTLDLFGQCKKVDLSSVYEIDFVGWSRRQAELLRAARRDELDLINLAEEIESMGRADLNAYGSHFRNLLVHLLKWQFQPARRSKSWRQSIINARIAIEDLEANSPSLGAKIDALLEKEYPRARKLAAIQMSIAQSKLPAELPYTLDQLQDSEFLPDGLPESRTEP